MCDRCHDAMIRDDLAEISFPAAPPKPFFLWADEYDKFPGIEPGTEAAWAERMGHIHNIWPGSALEEHRR